jgi:acetylornithine deacetylase
MRVVHMPVTPAALQNHPAFCDDGFPYDNRSNVIGILEGHNRHKAPSLILNGHTDVVSPGDESLWSDSPWSGKVDRGRIYGRGACDMKSGLAAGIFALEAIRRSDVALDGDLMIQCVAGEETGGCGTLAAIVEGYVADAAVIVEPTCLTICPVQSGALSFRLTIKGKSVHACMKNKGVNAIEKFVPLFQAVEAFNTERHRQYQNPLYPDSANVAPTCINVVNSGDWPSTVPDRLVADGRFGVFPDESVGVAKGRFENMLALAVGKDPWLKQHPPELEWREGQFEPGSTRLDAPIIKTIAACHATVAGAEPGVEGVTYGSDLRLFTNHAHIPAFLYGPGNVLDAHTVDESVSIAEIVQATKILALTICAWCGGR